MAQAGAGPSDSGSGYNIIRGTDDEANFMGMSLLPPRSTVVRRTTAAGAKRDFYTEEDDGYYDNWKDPNDGLYHDNWKDPND